MKHPTATLWLALTAFVSCKGEQSEHEMRNRVELYCAALSSDVQGGAEEYARFAPALDSGELSPEEAHRVVPLLVADGIGVSEPMQLVRITEIKKQLIFCATVRKIDQKQLDEIVRQYKDLSTSIDRAKTHVEKARALQALAKAARDVQSLPLYE